ncbi:MAG: hypothetical protein A3J74_07350 [Elusimicrobia bacterium RIFCSPHIGHO2_02_FULL_57_9]|nr:MAG: hypothetical protein A3J74_07350 [Elusimicrobia bacterium RIFCSPHIGHO2_02_FULL_57_9]
MVGRFGNGCLPFVGDRKRDLRKKRKQAQKRAEPFQGMAESPRGHQAKIFLTSLPDPVKRCPLLL